MVYYVKLLKINDIHQIFRIFFQLFFGIPQKNSSLHLEEYTEEKITIAKEEIMQTENPEVSGVSIHHANSSCP